MRLAIITTASVHGGAAFVALGEMLVALRVGAIDHLIGLFAAVKTG